MQKSRLIFLTLFLLVGISLSAHEWKAKFITLEHSQSRPCTWATWKKRVTLDSIPGSVTARIATDSKYWLWINDELVIFEGGLKRGPKPNASYYDEIEIAPYLKEGSNTISVLTWFFGLNGFSHVSSGMMGLVFEAIGDGVEICSGLDWEGSGYDAYSETGSPKPNYRISEGNIRYDAREEKTGWYRADYNKRLGNVLEMDVSTCPLGTLIRRPIPQWKDSGLIDYVNTEMRGDTLFCQLPYDCQITPYMKLESNKEGSTVKIQTDVHMIGKAPTVRCEYVTRSGVQEYENYGWMNGHQVWYIIPEGVKLLDVKYRETGYGADFNEPFKCNDEFFNELWKRAQRTLYVTMRDNYMDCPDRERGQWWGDAVNELGETFYCLSPSASQLTFKGFEEIFNWQREDGVMYSPCPAGNWNRELPCQILATVGYYGIYTQSFYSGDFSIADKYFDNLHKYIHEVWATDEDGMVYERQGGWQWGDWGKNIDMLLLQNVWYYLALKGEKLIAEKTGRTDAAAQAGSMMSKFEENFDRRFWNGSAYRNPQYTGETDDRGNALAVVSGLASEDKYALLTQLLTTEYHASPYMEKYVLEALFQMGADKQALRRTQERYQGMIEIPGLTTLPENWLKPGVEVRPGRALLDYCDGSYNHGWSGGPLTLLSQKVCGIEPTEPGFKTFRIKPQMGYLKDASCTVESVNGTIKVCIRKKGNSLKITATVPEGTTAQIVFPSGRSVLAQSGVTTVSGR